MILAVIHDGVDTVLPDAVHDAIQAADMEIVDIDPTFDPDADGLRLEPGDAILRVCTSFAAKLIEDRLGGPGVATLSPTSGFEGRDLPTVWRARGLPVRQETPLLPLTRNRATDLVRSLGGFPVGLRACEAEGQAHLLRMDSLPALHSALDLLEATDASALLGPWEERPVLWRMLIVDGRAIDAAKRVAEGLAWTAAGERMQRVPPRADVAAIAEAALGALGIGTGTVDLQERRDTTFALLDADAPPPIHEVAAWCSEEAIQALVGILQRS